MFAPFFLNRQWALWSWLGGAFILVSTWYQVQLDVKITEWFRTFYDTLQKALSKPNSVTFEEFLNLGFDERNQNPLRQLVVQPSKTTWNKGEHPSRQKTELQNKVYDDLREWRADDRR